MEECVTAERTSADVFTGFWDAHWPHINTSNVASRKELQAKLLLLIFKDDDTGICGHCDGS